MSQPARGGIKQAWRNLAAFLARHGGWLFAICLVMVMLRVFLLPALTPRQMNLMMAQPAQIDSQWANEDMRILSQTISDYLSFSRASAQALIHVGGESVPAFQSHELHHLMDVRNLFSLSFLLAGGALLVLLASAIIIMSAKTGRLAARVKALAGAWQKAALLTMGILGLLGLLAAIGFDQVFHGMHKLLFRNELWLLDPRKDLLIQLMPRQFFVEYALYAIKPVISLLSVMVAASTVARVSAAFAMKPREIDG